MSRRSRKRRAGAGGGGNLWGKVAIGLIVVLVLGFAALYTGVRGYLHSDSFRKFLSLKVSEAARVSGEFRPFRWDGLAVDTSAFEAAGEGLVRDLKLEGLHTEVGLSGLRSGAWVIRESRVQRMEVVLDGRKMKGLEGTIVPDEPVPAELEKQAEKVMAKKPGWLPSEVDLQGMDVGHVLVRATLKQGLLEARGMRARVEPAGGRQAYKVEVADGEIDVPYAFVPEIRLKRAKLRYQDNQVFLNRLDARVWRNGVVDGFGEWNIETGRYAFDGELSGVKCEELLSEDWAKRLVGDVRTSYSVTNHGGSLVARGRLKIGKSTLTALPVLDALAAYADTRRFRVLNLSEAHSDWRWKDGEVFLSDLVLASEGLVRLEGSMMIRGREIDGVFRLGLVPGALASIPGAETDVFMRGERGLMWAPLRITGTLDDPREDLTDRLKDAAGMRMFDVIPDTGEKVIKFTRSVIGNAPDEVVDKGMKLIEKGTRSVERSVGDVGGIIDGFFGSSRQPDPPEEEP